MGGWERVTYSDRLASHLRCKRQCLGFLEGGDKNISDVATVDKHAGLQVIPIEGDDEIVGIRVSRGLEGAMFDRHGRVGGVRTCAQWFGIRCVWRVS